MKQQQLIEALEALTDKTTLADVIIALSLMCDEKAEHIVCTWQDKATAKPWTTASNQLMAIARKTNV